MTALIVLSQIGIDIGPLIAGAGVAGLAIGFGAQKLVQDVIGGFFLLVEDQFRIGDLVELVGVTGQVQDIRLRVTVLRDVSGNIHYVPNGDIRVATNRSQDRRDPSNGG
jgi:small conductance mechanosensitive channel